MELIVLDKGFEVSYMNYLGLDKNEIFLLFKNFPPILLGDYYLHNRDNLLYLTIKEFYIKDTLNYLIVKIKCSDNPIVIPIDTGGIGIVFDFDFYSPRLLIRYFSENTSTYRYLNFSSLCSKSGGIIKRLNYYKEFDFSFIEEGIHNLSAKNFAKKIKKKEGDFFFLLKRISYSNYSYFNTPYELMEYIGKTIKNQEDYKFFPNVRGQSLDMVFLEAIRNKNYNLVKFLIYSGASLFTKGKDNIYAIYKLGEIENINLLKEILLTNEFQLNYAKDFNLLSSIDVVKFFNPTSALILLPYTNISQEGISFWKYCFENKNHYLLRHLPNNILLQMDKDGLSYFHYAIIYKDVYLFYHKKELLWNFLYYIDKNGYSFLDYTIKYNSWQMFNYVLRLMSKIGNITLTNHTVGLLKNVHANYFKKLDEQLKVHGESIFNLIAKNSQEEKL